MVSIYFALLLFWVKQDFVSCVHMKTSVDVFSVSLGDSLTLNCTYNCSSGFVRGCWSKSPDNSGCQSNLSRKGIFCMVSLHLPNVTTQDLKNNYTCYTLNTEDYNPLHNTRRVVLLQLHDQTRVPNWTVTPATETTNASLPAKPKDSHGGEFTGIQVLATVSVAVAMVLSALALYLCLSCSNQRWSCKGDPDVSRSGSPRPSSYSSGFPAVKGTASTQSERVTLRIPTPESESDTEVPYADIMITVRGVSTPELTQCSYSSPGDQKEWWGDECRSHLQASRSADRLHVPHPREVSRKMSTNSEYAVITYA